MTTSSSLLGSYPEYYNTYYNLTKGATNTNYLTTTPTLQNTSSSTSSNSDTDTLSLNSTDSQYYVDDTGIMYYTDENGITYYSTDDGVSFSSLNKLNGSLSSSETTSKSTDGKDDGKISLWEKVKSGVSGAAKGIINGVADILSDPKKIALTAGAIALSIACPPAGVALAAVGAAGGAIQVGKGIYNATKATTDAEAKEAFENIGSGTLQVGLSVVGAKAGLKNCGNTTAAITAESSGGISGAVYKAGNVAKAFGKDATTSLARNTKLGANIASSLDDAGSNATFGTKATAVKNGATKTLSDSTSTLRGNVNQQGIFKGTYKTAADSIKNLKETGYSELNNNASKAQTKLKTAVENLDDTKYSSLKEMKLDTADDISTFQKAVSETKDLTTKEKITLNSIAETAEKNLKKIEKIDNTIVEKSEAIAKKVEKGKLDEIKAEEKLSKLAEKENKSSTLTGVKAKVNNWAKERIQNNAQEAAKINNIESVTANDVLTAKQNVDSLKKELNETKSTASKSDGTNISTAESKLKAAKAEYTKLKQLYDSISINNETANISQTYSATKGYIFPTLSNNISYNE